MKAKKLRETAKQASSIRFNLEANYLNLKALLLDSATVGLYEYTKLHLFPLNIEKAIQSRLEKQGYKVHLNDEGHIIRVTW